MSKRVGIPAAAAVLLAVSPWITWWTTSFDDPSMSFHLDARMSLYDSTGCALGQCTTVADAPGAWRAFGLVVLVIVLAAALAAGALAVYARSERDADLPVQLLRISARATLVAIVVAMAYALFTLDGSPSWGPLFAGAGGVLGMFAAAEHVIDAPIAHITAGPARDRGGLRFALLTASIEEAGLRVVGADGDDRLLAWRDLARAVARRLPPDPPYDKATFVDLVPSHGAPVRLVAATRVDWASLPGGAAPTTKENWRRLVAHARASNPAIAIDRESAPFFAGGEAPMFPAWKLFLAYDARYDRHPSAA